MIRVGENSCFVFDPKVRSHWPALVPDVCIGKILLKGPFIWLCGAARSCRLTSTSKPPCVVSWGAPSFQPLADCQFWLRCLRGAGAGGPFCQACPAPLRTAVAVCLSLAPIVPGPEALPHGAGTRMEAWGHNIGKIIQDNLAPHFVFPDDTQRIRPTILPAMQNPALGGWGARDDTLRTLEVSCPFVPDIVVLPLPPSLPVLLSVLP